MKRLEINYDLVLEAIKGLFRSKFGREKSLFFDDSNKHNVLDASTIIHALRAVILKREDIDQIIAIAENCKTSTNMCGVKIELFELKKDY